MKIKNRIEGNVIEVIDYKQLCKKISVNLTFDSIYVPKEIYVSKKITKKLEPLSARNRT